MDLYIIFLICNENLVNYLKKLLQILSIYILIYSTCHWSNFQKRFVFFSFCHCLLLVQFAQSLLNDFFVLFSRFSSSFALLSVLSKVLSKIIVERMKEICGHLNSGGNSIVSEIICHV